MCADVAVVAPFYRAVDHVPAWLDALAAQDAPARIYLVDDASPDGTARALADGVGARGMDAEVLALRKNVGPAAARNRAIRRALEDGATLVLLLDSDCRVEPDWVRRHVRAHAEHPEAAIIGGGMRGSANSTVGRADGYASWFTSVPGARPREVTRLHLCSTNMSIRAEVFADHGLYFDESLATGEDVAFCRSARKAGLRIRLQPDIVALHLDRDNVHEAARHHYRWGLHSHALSTSESGGYYGPLARWGGPRAVAVLAPALAVAQTALVLGSYARTDPGVWRHVPWILYLKAWNALGVYDGFRDPSRCRRVPESSHG